MVSTLECIWKAATQSFWGISQVTLCKMLRKAIWMWKPLLNLSSQLDWLFFCALKVEIFEEKDVRKLNSPKLFFLSPFPSTFFPQAKAMTSPSWIHPYWLCGSHSQPEGNKCYTWAFINSHWQIPVGNILCHCKISYSNSSVFPCIVYLMAQVGVYQLLLLLLVITHLAF